MGQQDEGLGQQDEGLGQQDEGLGQIFKSNPTLELLCLKWDMLFLKQDALVNWLNLRGAVERIASLYRKL